MKILKYIVIAGFIAGVFMIPSSAKAALIDNLISYWKLDESSGNAADSVGGNTLTNTGVVYTTGKINNGADFEAGDAGDKLEIADGSQSGLDITGNISVSLWVKLESAPGGDYILFSKWNATGNQRGYQMWYQPGTINFQISSDGSNSDLYSVSQTLTAGSWYHLAFTWKASTSQGEWYVNGTNTASPTGALTAIFNNTASFVLGNYAATIGEDYDGIIDEVGIWPRALTSTEVTTLYNGGAGCQHSFGACETIASIPILGLVWSYIF